MEGNWKMGDWHPMDGKSRPIGWTLEYLGRTRSTRVEHHQKIDEIICVVKDLQRRVDRLEGKE